MENWVNNLAEYYAHNDPPQIRIDMLLKVFGDEEDEIMGQAATEYMKEQRHFPQVAELRPYVEAARELSRGDWGAAAGVYTDDDIYAWEVARGTMQPEDEIEKEMEAARLVVAERMEEMGR
jgi:hypothetical protein